MEIRLVFSKQIGCCPYFRDEFDNIIIYLLVSNKHKQTKKKQKNKKTKKTNLKNLKNKKNKRAQ